MKPQATKQAKRERRSQRTAQTPISPADLDEALVQSIEETLRNVLLFSTRPPYMAKDKAETAFEKEWIENRWQSAHQSLSKTMKLPRGCGFAEAVVGWVVGLSALGLFVAFLALIATQGDSGWLPVLLALLSLAVGLGGAYLSEKQQAKWKKARTFVPETLVQIVPLIEHKTAMESAYAAAVAALMPHVPVWGQAATQSHLRDLQTLFHEGKEATACRAEIEQAVSRQSVQDAETEANKLAERLEHIHDAAARAVYTHSLAHLEGRRDRLQHMEPLRERLEARESAVLQALRETQITLADAHFMGVKTEMPALAAGSVCLEDLADTAASAPWTNTVSRIRRQTVSVETAVQEVMGTTRAAV